MKSYEKEIKYLVSKGYTSFCKCFHALKNFDGDKEKAEAHLFERQIKSRFPNAEEYMEANKFLLEMGFNKNKVNY